MQMDVEIMTTYVLFWEVPCKVGIVKYQGYHLTLSSETSTSVITVPVLTTLGKTRR